MLIHRLTEPGRVGRYTQEGNIEHGGLFVDENGVIRWVSVDEQIDLEGVDRYVGGRHGHNVYRLVE